MTTFTKSTLTTLLKIAVWVIDNDPAPNTDATLNQLRATLQTEREELAASVAAAQPH